MLTERENPFNEEPENVRKVDEAGWVRLSATNTQMATMPVYSLELPEHVTGRMMLTGQDGHVKFDEGPSIYQTAHRHGWDDFLRLFLEQEINLNDPQTVKHFAENPSTEYWDLAREARAKGIYDCYQALKKQSAKKGANVLRQQFHSSGG
jgi:hypothetical protein